MKNNRLIVIALMIIVVILIYFIVNSIRKTHDMLIAPQEQVLPEEKEEPVIHAIPENRIPSTEEIEKKITESETRKNTQKNAAAKISKEKSLITPLEEISMEASKEPIQTPVSKLLRQKKEVKFPTYEERQKGESQTGVIAY